MIDARTRGALLGVANGVTIALLYAIDRHDGYVFSIIRLPWFVDATPTIFQLFLAVAMHTVPVGICWGTMLGGEARDMSGSWLRRAFKVSLAAFLLTMVSSVPWPAIARDAVLSAVVYSFVLAWWVTRTEDPWPEDVNLDDAS